MKLKITVALDNPESWMAGHVGSLLEILKDRCHDVTFCTNAGDIPEGDIALFLSCEHIVSKEILKKNKHNLVVHESDLPKGKGWSPLTWQILEGRNEIPIALFEAAEKVDSGPIYYTDKMIFEGHELIDEMRKRQAKKTFELFLRFLDDYPNVRGIPQKGEETFYKKRTQKDSEINVDKTIREQFNLLRVVDNERYPAFFNIGKKKYLIKIYKEDKNE